MSQIVINGNNIDILKTYPDNYFDAVVTDPPYGLGKEPNAAELMKDWIEYGYHEVSGSGFMGKEWDAFVPQPVFWKEVFRVLKHGGHVLSFFGTRTYDWGVMSMRFAGFEVRDCIQWLYGSGFPKSHNIGKAIDKMEGNEREVIGKYQLPDFADGIRKKQWDCNVKSEESVFGASGQNIVTKGNSEWEGWGSALKPANEPIVLARKPLEKGLSIAENILKWGVGGINIDATRIGFKDDADYKESTQKNQHADFGTKPLTNNNVYGDYSMVQPKNYQPEGRFPANIIFTHHEDCECKNEEVENWDCHEDCPIRILDEQSGISKSPKTYKRNSDGINDKIYGQGIGEKSGKDSINFGDVGGASRFFYVAKASKSERNNGLDGFEEKNKPDNYIMPKLTCSVCGSKRVDSSNKLVCGCKGETHYEEQNSLESKNNLAGGNKNFHPTIKPVKLMRYLVKMITPQNGIVLDPFCGSGTTGIACKLEGFEFVGMEQDPEYCKIAEGRINNYKEEKEKTPKNKLKEDNKELITTQTTLF
jgi:site-specific DNA-methyltransferase (adenine-specific)